MYERTKQELQKDIEETKAEIADMKSNLEDSEREREKALTRELEETKLARIHSNAACEAEEEYTEARTTYDNASWLVQYQKEMKEEGWNEEFSVQKQVEAREELKTARERYEKAKYDHDNAEMICNDSWDDVRKAREELESWEEGIRHDQEQIDKYEEIVSCLEDQLEELEGATT